MTDIIIPVLDCNEDGLSIFTERSYTLEDFNGLFISERQNALNFRHRMSQPGYCSDWHVAGDPTLIIIRKGTLRIGLRDNSYRDFMPGDMFIAQDRLKEDVAFNHDIHGHTAKLIGSDTLLAVHIKLEKL